MSDNVLFPPTGAAGVAATDQVAYSGDSNAQVQLTRPVHVTGAEGSKTVVNLVKTTTPGAGDAGLLTRDIGQVATIGAINEAAPASDTASSGLNGRLQRLAQHLTSLLAKFPVAFPAALAANGGMKVELVGTTFASAVPVLIAALSTTVQTVFATGKILDSYYIYNPNSTVAYVQVFDVSGAVTLGTTAPKASLGIPPGGAANLAGVNWGFTNAIKVAATTTATGSTAPAIALDCNFGYLP